MLQTKYCPNCGVGVNQKTEFEMKSHAEVLSGTEKKQMSTVAKLFLAIISSVVLVSIYLSATSQSGSNIASTASQPTQAAVVDTSWIPSDYVQFSDSLAWHFLDAKCTPILTYCFRFGFISHLGCPNGFYAAINWTDASGAVVDYSNATLPSLQPNQVAKLTFEPTQEFKSFDVSEIKCY